MLCQTTHLVHRRSVHLRVDVTRAKEQHRLEQRVVNHVQQRTTHTTHTHERATRCMTYRSNTQTDKYNAHVLNT